MQQMKAAIYLRVSTDKQSVAAQRGELRELCKRRGWSNVTEYVDVESECDVQRCTNEGSWVISRRHEV